MFVPLSSVLALPSAIQRMSDHCTVANPNTSCFIRVLVFWEPGDVAALSNHPSHILALPPKSDCELPTRSRMCL